MRFYRDQLKSKDNALNIDEKFSDELSIEGRVLRFNQDVKNGYTYFYLLLAEKEDKIFIGSSRISQELPLTKVGDFVSIKYDKSSGEYLDMTEFDNKTLLLSEMKK